MASASLSARRCPDSCSFTTQPPAARSRNISPRTLRPFQRWPSPATASSWPRRIRQGTIKIWADARKLTSKSTALLTLKGHHGAITTVGFSSDGKRLVTTSADKTARVWDLENAGAAIRPLEKSGFSQVARFSPDGQLIAAAAGNSVRLWDAATGQLVRELPAGDGKGSIHSVAFSPTDNRLLAVGYGGQPDVSYVALWDIDAGTELARLPGATDLPELPMDRKRPGSRRLGVFARWEIPGRRFRLQEPIDLANDLQVH